MTHVKGAVKSIEPSVMGEKAGDVSSVEIRAVDAAGYSRRIEAETPAQSQAHRERYAEAHHLVRNRQSQRIRDEAIHFIEAQEETHNCGPMHIICQFSKSKNFAAERPSDGKFTSCCRKGKLKLEKPSDALKRINNSYELSSTKNLRTGIPVILSSSFERSLRNMRERCADAMSIFAKYVAPDLFITFTANLKWPEITENLRPSEHTTDRPEL
ncbi:hypothetical protein AVEN_246594-1 [Araneus ventricosus]|uniref:Helitron helicase-like domain-containing protein n=1 Tax=Araneus ventricosus TaxID=182803 RepID=A0A4Y2DCB5_ARAVE|nr:hypothetical protein AVEN_246594-1 [Araneus ventricosus]